VVVARMSRGTEQPAYARFAAAALAEVSTAHWIGRLWSQAGWQRLSAGLCSIKFKTISWMSSALTFDASAGESARGFGVHLNRADDPKAARVVRGAEEQRNAYR
jgi:hypothetical protein